MSETNLDALSGHAAPIKADLSKDLKGTRGRRVELRPYDHGASMMLSPHAMSPVSDGSDEQLWTTVAGGNKGVAYFSQVAGNDEQRRGIAISRMATVVEAMDQKFKDETDRLCKPVEGDEDDAVANSMARSRLVYVLGYVSK